MEKLVEYRSLEILSRHVSAPVVMFKFVLEEK